jgi:hypothetical protein
MTRKQLLDEIDGIVLVLDCSPERIRDNGPAIEELQQSLAAYGRRLDALPLVLQYNKRDVADPFAIEDLHRQIGIDQAAVFETIATTGHGILPTLTTISKHVVRARRGGSGEIDAETAAAAAEGASVPEAPAPPPEPPVAEPDVLSLDAMPEPLEAEPTLEELELFDEVEPLDEAEPLEAIELDADLNETSTAELLESAILAEGEEQNFQPLGALEWAEEAEVAKPAEGSLQIVSVGQATVEADGGVRLPLVLGDEDGSSRSVVLSLRLDALATEDDEI